MTSPEKELENGIQQMKENLVVPDVVKQRIKLTLANLPKLEQEPSVKKNKRRKWWIGSMTAASILIGSFVTTYNISADFKEYVKKIITVDYDKGYQNAQKEEVVQPLNLSVTDQGYTVEIKEVLAEGKDISIVYQIKDPQGKGVSCFAVYSNITYRTDPEVEKALPMKMIDPITKKETKLTVDHVKPASESEFLTSNKVHGPGILKLVSPVEVPDKAIIRFEMKQLIYEEDMEYYKENNVPELHVKGNWTIDIPIDMTKAKAKQKVGKSEGKLQLPFGQFSIDSLQLYSSKTILKSTYAAGEEGLGRARYFPLEYELLDANGKIFYKSQDIGMHEYPFSQGGQISDPENGKVAITENFLAFPSSPYYTYRLKAIWREIKPNRKVPFQVNQDINVEGYTFRIESLKLQKEDDYKFLNISGSPSNDYTSMTVRFYDAKGNETGSGLLRGMGSNSSILLFDTRNWDSTTTMVIKSMSKRYPVDWETKIYPQPAK